MSTLEAKSRLYVALDVGSLGDAIALMNPLREIGCGVKIGKQLFTVAGPAAVEAAHDRGLKVFLDLKFHDIPSTVEGAARSAVQLGVQMFNVHCSGGFTMMFAAATGASEGAESAKIERPLVLGVTVLTSRGYADYVQEGLAPELNEDAPERIGKEWVRDCVLRYTTLTRDVGLDGVIASPQEVGSLRQAWEAGALVIPGVRPGGKKVKGEDQARTGTPTTVIQAGGDRTYLVVGRPITQAVDKAAAAQAIVDEIEAATT